MHALEIKQLIFYYRRGRSRRRPAANELSADAIGFGCLMKQDRRTETPILHIRAGFIKVGHAPNYNLGFQTESNRQHRGARVITRWSRTLGGFEFDQHGLNYTRGNRFRLTTPGHLGQPGWSYADVYPFNEPSPKSVLMIPSTEARKACFDTDCDWRHPLCDAFIAGAAET